MSIFKRYGSRMVVTLVTIILIIIIGITASYRNNITTLEDKIGKYLTPVQKIFYNVGETISGTFRSFGSLVDLKDENEDLKREIARLKELNRNYEDIISRSEVLRNEAILKQTANHSYIEASITGKEPGNWFDKFIIDKGLKDGLKKGSPVVQAIKMEDDVVVEGLVGRVIEVGDNWAKVLSIIDEGSNVSFKVIRTQDGGIAKGSIEGELSGYLFDTKADVVEGDNLVTSGLGEVYIDGLYIGEIEEVYLENDELMKSIKINPAVDFKKLYRVFVIIENK